MIYVKNDASYQSGIGQSGTGIDLDRGKTHTAWKGEKPMELTKERLAEMAAVDVRTVDISTLTDLKDIEIDASLPVAQKLEAFARQTNNVYVNRIGDYVVKVGFQENGASIDDRMAEYLQRLSEIPM